MWVEGKNENFKEIIDKFKIFFEVFNQLFNLSQTLNIHVIIDHCSDYFEILGKHFKETNGEHYNTLHHPLKIMERNKELYVKKKSMADTVHQQKKLKSISIRNVLSAGYTSTSKLRIRRHRNSSISSEESPHSTHKKGVYNIKKSFITYLLTKNIEEEYPCIYYSWGACQLVYSTEGELTPTDGSDHRDNGEDGQAE